MLRGVVQNRGRLVAALLALVFGLALTCPANVKSGDTESKETSPPASTHHGDTEKTVPKPDTPADTVERTSLSENIPAVADTTKGRDELPSLGWTAFWTLVVVIAIVVCFYLVRRFLPGSRLFLASDAITVLARRNITAAASLFLVQMGRKVIRVGLTRDRMSFLGEVSDPDEIAYIQSLSPSANKESATKAFESELKIALAKEEMQETTPGASESEKQEIEALRQEIAKIRGMIDGWK